MGTDSPIAALSEKPRLLFDYFAQLFAQVTNPPLDAIREELVTSLYGSIGPEANLLEPSAGVLPSGRAAVPGDQQRRPGQDPSHQPPTATSRASSRTCRAASTPTRVGSALAARLIDEICAEVRPRSPSGARIIVLSDRHSTAEHAPIPSLLLTGAVHHHLVREKAAPRSAWWSRPVTSARCTTSRCSSATARPRSTRTSPWSPSRTSPATAYYVKVEPELGRQAT
jgi:glutamate synthase (NADPH/NADH) large chain